MLEIREVPLGGDITDFLEVASYIYRHDPNYVRPLDMDLKDRLSPKKNPFFEHGEGTLFVAYKSGKPVGRISAQIDRSHLERHNDKRGFFGFFDTTNDEEVARGLLARAERWLKERGVERVRGPMSLSINEEMGCLVEGFDSPPFVMMPHHNPYQADLIEHAGYAKDKDVFAWRYETGEMNTRVKKAQADFRAMPEVTSRPFSMKTLASDVEIAVDIFNDAWSENWGFVPITRAEGQKMASDFKLILMPEITRMVYIDGEPAAMAIAIPNLNELVHDLGGSLFPTGVFKLLYRLKIQGARSGRLLLLGVRKKYRFVRKYAAMSLFLYAEMNDAGRRCGMTWGELSWTLEDNAAVNTAIKMMGAKKYKTYRLFTKELVADKAASVAAEQAS